MCLHIALVKQSLAAIPIAIPITTPTRPALTRPATITTTATTPPPALFESKFQFIYKPIPNNTQLKIIKPHT